MTRTRAETVDCTRCGVGLDVLGGGRVRAHVCGSCGAELDAQDGYRVLRRFLDLERPATPLAIGMRGEVYGIAVTVIGIVAKREDWAGGSAFWVEHQVFSPTHGYAWLSLEDGHFVFTRKIRTLPNPDRLSEAKIEAAEKRPVARLGWNAYKYYASGRPAVTFVEGEFNFVPQIGPAGRYVDLLGRDAMLTMAESQGQRRGVETEYELSTLLDRADLLASFGLDRESLPRPRGGHPLQPFARSALARYTRNLAFGAAAACVLIGVLLLGAGSTLHEARGLDAGRPYETGFSVRTGRGLVELTLRADVVNAWAFFEGEITDAEDETVAEFGREVGYYRGVEGGESWSEGSQQGYLRLDLPPGDYAMQVAVAEAGGWRGGRPPTRMAVEIREGVASAFWLWLGAVGFALFGASYLLSRALHERRRWRGSDWDDD